MITESVLHFLADPPNPAPAPPPGLEAPTAMFLSWLKWGALIAGSVGFTLSAIMMIVGRRNRSSMAADGASGIPWIIGGLSVASIAAGVVGVLLK